MASFVPVAFTALQAFQAVSSVANVIKGADQSRSNNDLALKQLQQQQTLQQQKAFADAQLQKEEISAKAADAERLRKDALKRAVARQRAQFGASGVVSGGGSSEAVLLGLFDESEEQKANRKKLDKLKLNSIDLSLGNVSRVNTLKRTQLKEKQKLQETSLPFETADDLFSIF